MDSVRRDARRGGPLRLLWLIDSLTIGGAERLAVSFAREAAGVGIQLRVCSLKRIDGNPLERELAETGVPCEVLNATHLRDRRAFARLQRLMREERFDILHAHLMYATIWGVPAARFAGVPCVATLHVPPSTEPPWSRQRIRERLMCGLLNRSNATVIAVSAALRDRHLRRGLLDARRLIVVQNGIDAERCPTANAEAAAALGRAFSLPAGARVIIATAVLREPRKGVHVLLDAFPRVLSACPTAQLIVVGDGPLKPALQAQSQRLGVERAVHWAGTRNDVASLLAGADLFVHAALDDPFPTAVLEAMAAALPVVATTVDGIPEMITSAVSGRLVPPADSAALSAAIAELLTNPETRSALGAAARRVALERFSTQVWARTLRDVYDRAVGTRPAETVRDHDERRVAP